MTKGTTHSAYEPQPSESQQASCPRRRGGQQSQGGLGHTAGAQQVIQCVRGPIPAKDSKRVKQLKMDQEALEHKIRMMRLQMVFKMRALGQELRQ